MRIDILSNEEMKSIHEASLAILEDIGITLPPAGKANVGLGRPLAEEETR